LSSLTSLWHFNVLTRCPDVSDHFKYSFYDVKDSGADIGFLIEYHRDDRDIQAPATFLDDNIFVGSRITLNDVDDTAFLGGVMVDRSSKTRFYSIEASKRVGDRWKVEFDVRLYSHINNTQSEFGLRKDDHVQLRIARYF
jgi:hypothetical protein